MSITRYVYKTFADRQRLQELWEQPECTVKEVAEQMHMPLRSIYAELKRGQDGTTRLPDFRLKYDANLAQLRMQQSIERRGRRNARRQNIGELSQKIPAERIGAS